MDFVAIDFETANYQRVSACQVGLARVRNGQVVSTLLSYINPVGGHLPFFDKFHGITAEYTKHAPSFDKLVVELRPWLEGAPLVSYTGFDKQVLNALSKYYGISFNLEHVDACTLAKERLFRMPQHRLKDVAAVAGLPSWKHHDALADAITCAKVYEWLLASTGDAYNAVAGIRATPKPAKTHKPSPPCTYSVPALPSPISERRKLTLASIVDDIFDDGKVDVFEAVSLCYILEDNRLTELPHFSSLYQTLRNALEDDVITQEETKFIKQRVCDCIDAIGLETNLDRPRN